MKKVTFITTTSTFANKGRDELQRNRIQAEVKKVQEGTVAGCLFGISVPSSDADNAKKVLTNGGIRIISVRDD